MNSSGPMAAMAIPAYRRLFFSATIVIFGVMGQAVARGWMARELTGSNTGLGGVMLVFGGAMLVATPFGGVAADRYAKRLVMLTSVAGLSLSSLLVGLAAVSGEARYWMLLCASATQAAAFAFYLPARVALIAEVVPSGILPAAIVTAQSAQEVGRVLAPALAGAMIGASWFGPGGVFLASAATSIVAMVLLHGLPTTAPRDQIDRSPLREAMDALRYTRASDGLRAVTTFMVAVVMLGFPYLTFLPTLASERFEVGALGYGVMSAVGGGGAVAAGALTSRRGSRRPWLTISCAAGVFAMSLIGLGLAPGLSTALPLLAVIGGSALIFQTACQALMLRLSALEYHGRVQSFLIIGFSGFGLAALPLGLLADATSLGFTLGAMGAGVLVMTVAFALMRWRSRSRWSSVPLG